MTRWLVPFLLVFVPVAASAQDMTADACAGLTAAWIKGLHTPRYTTISLSNGGARIQMIWLDDKMYVMRTGMEGWAAADATAADGEDKYRQSIADAGESCRAAGTETHDGETFDLILTHRTEKAGAVDSTIWIARSTGLVERSEDVFADNRSRMMTVTHYGDVHVPNNLLPPY